MKVCPKQKVQCVQVGSNTKDNTRENERQVKLLMRLLLLSNLI